MLDTCWFSSIIYIWYADGELRPSLVRSKDFLASPFRKLNTRGRCPDAKSAGINVSVPGGRHEASGAGTPE